MDFYFEITPNCPPDIAEKQFRKATPGSAGLDLYIPVTVKVPAKSATPLMRLGVAAAVPVGHVGLVVPRSSTGRLGISLANTTGVIDSDYRGEWLISMRNHSDEDVILEYGKAYFQVLIVPVTHVNPIAVNDLDEAAGITLRGTGGHGSTGN